MKVGENHMVQRTNIKTSYIAFCESGQCVIVFKSSPRFSSGRQVFFFLFKSKKDAASRDQDHFNLFHQ